MHSFMCIYLTVTLCYMLYFMFHHTMCILIRSQAGLCPSPLAAGDSVVVSKFYTQEIPIPKQNDEESHHSHRMWSNAYRFSFPQPNAEALGEIISYLPLLCLVTYDGRHFFPPLDLVNEDSFSQIWQIWGPDTAYSSASLYAFTHARKFLRA